MKDLSLFSICIFATFINLSSNAALDRVGDFALLDYVGEFHQLSRYRHRQGLVVMAYDESCAGMTNHVNEYQLLANEFTQQGLDFVFLDSMDIGREAFANSDLGLPVLEDEGQLVSEALGIQNAGDVRVLNPERLSIYYRGSVYTQLRETLQGVLNGAVSDTVSTPIESCSIPYPVQEKHSQTPPNYVTDVAPIVMENCAGCHRQGGVGPFALDSYIMLLGWSPMIREVILNKRMPPMQVDPYIGHSDDARYLDTEEMQTLVHWIDAGAPQGDDSADPLEELANSINLEATAEWYLGEPDFIVTGPSNDVPPTGVLDYVYENVDLPFNEGKWIRAVNIELEMHLYFIT